MSNTTKVAVIIVRTQLYMLYEDSWAACDAAELYIAGLHYCDGYDSNSFHQEAVGLVRRHAAEFNEDLVDETDEDYEPTYDVLVDTGKQYSVAVGNSCTGMKTVIDVGLQECELTTFDKDDEFFDELRNNRADRKGVQMVKAPGMTREELNLSLLEYDATMKESMLGIKHVPDNELYEAKRQEALKLGYTQEALDSVYKLTKRCPGIEIKDYHEFHSKKDIVKYYEMSGEAELDSVGYIIIDDLANGHVLVKDFSTEYAARCNDV